MCTVNKACLNKAVGERLPRKHSASLCAQSVSQLPSPRGTIGGPLTPPPQLRWLGGRHPGPSASRFQRERGVPRDRGWGPGQGLAPPRITLPAAGAEEWRVKQTAGEERGRGRRGWRTEGQGTRARAYPLSPTRSAASPPCLPSLSGSERSSYSGRLLLRFS